MAEMKGLVISEAVIEKLRTRVVIGDERELRDFVTDALNTYVALGGLVVGGAELQMRDPDTGATRRVRLPFELRRNSAQPEAEVAPAGA